MRADDWADRPAPRKAGRPPAALAVGRCDVTWRRGALARWLWRPRDEPAAPLELASVHLEDVDVRLRRDARGAFNWAARGAAAAPQEAPGGAGVVFRSSARVEESTAVSTFRWRFLGARRGKH